MLSRVADRCYWLARYLERVENSARLVKVYSGLLLDLPESTGVGWDVVLAISTDTDLGVRSQTGISEQDRLNYLLSDLDNPSALLTSLSMARENARTSRDILPTEAWRAINEVYLYAQERLPRASQARQRDAILSTLVERVQGIVGLMAGTMSHGAAYQYMRLGRNLERADMTTRVIDVAAAALLTDRPELARFDNTLWMAVLRCLSAYQAYRQYVRRRVNSNDVIGFLLQDPQFPRAISHCVAELRIALEQLPRSEMPLQRAENLLARIDALEFDAADVHGLHGLMDELQLEIARVNDAIVSNWFLPDTGAL